MDWPIKISYGRVNLSTVSAPAVVGEIGVFMGVPRTATIEATKQIRALRVESDDLQKFGTENPRFLARLMKQVGNHFTRFNQRSDSTTKCAGGALASTIAACAA